MDKFIIFQYFEASAALKCVFYYNKKGGNHGQALSKMRPPDGGSFLSLDTTKKRENYISRYCELLSFLDLLILQEGQIAINVRSKPDRFA